MKRVNWFGKQLSKKQKTDAPAVQDRPSSPVKSTGSAPDILRLERHLSDTYQWINEIAKELDMPDRKDVAYTALRTVLHSLRDRLTYEELFQFSAQLPLLIRGLLFEGYHYPGKPDKFHVQELLKRVDAAMGPSSGTEPDVIFNAVLRVLYRHVSRGEMDDLSAIMPKDIRELWDGVKAKKLH